jgi:hypothetical protein
MTWLTTTYAGLFYLGAQLSLPSPVLREINTYVSKVNRDKTLLISRYSTSYGHPMRPGKDSIFWAWHTDHKSSAILYYAASKLVKVKEIARYGNSFCENNYYLKDGHLLFVAERQVSCSLDQQRAIWLKNAPVCTSEKDCFFRGSYFFVADSCIAKQEHGEMQLEPEGYPGYKPGTLSQFLPLQAARYVAAFSKAPVQKK